MKHSQKVFVEWTNHGHVLTSLRVNGTVISVTIESVYLIQVLNKLIESNYTDFDSEEIT